MKLTTFALLAFALQVSANGHAQEKINLSFNKAPLEKVFNSIMAQTNYSILCRAEYTKGKIVTIQAKDLNIEEALNLCLKGLDLTFQIVGTNVAIRLRKKEAEKGIVTKDPSSPPGDIKGRVVNENGEPVLASIVVKGTNKGTTTNESGDFFLPDVEDDAILVISGVGFETIEFKINGKSALVVTVKIAVRPLEETVIKGYYTTTRKLNTGSVSIIKSEDIQKQPVTNTLAALIGRVPGLQVTQGSGAPGTNITVRIRGQNSIGSGNDPLFIVDGVPFNSASLYNSSLSSPAGIISSPFNSLNPSDIESIEVLKDADATAIYGSRGANGVILITTKKGKAGKTKVDLNFYTGVGEVTRMVELLNTQQYLEMRREAFKNDGATILPTNAYDVNGTWDTTRYTDWQKLMIGGTARYYNSQVSVSGGNANTQFLIGSGYNKETTVFPGDFSDERASVHLSLSNRSINDKFKTVLTSFYSYDKNVLPQTDFTQFTRLSPNAPELYNEDGTLNWQNSTWTNPFSNLFKKSKAVTETVVSNIVLSYQILQELQLKSSFGYTSAKLNQLYTSPKSSLNPATATANQVSATFVNTDTKTWIIEPQLNFEKRLWKGKLIVLLGTSFQQEERNSIAQTGNGFSNDALIENIQAATTVNINRVEYSKYRYNAAFGRIYYDWKEKYLINLVGRRDGSSRFGPGRRFSNFGSLGAAWIFSKEKFVQKHLSFLSYGKLRGSYGTTGNDQIGDYQFLDTYGPFASSASYQSIVGLQPMRLLNPDYSWEEVKKFEAGVELGFLNDNVLFAISYYSNRTSNQLLRFPLPGITGRTDVVANLPALVGNSGIELELNTNIIKHTDLTWSTAFTLTIPRNKLIEYPDIGNSPYATTYVVGEPLFITKGYSNNGVNPATGLYTFEDFDKDNRISFPNDYQSVSFIGKDYHGGLENSLFYKKISLDFFFQFEKLIARNYMSSFGRPGTLTNQPVYVLNRWQKPGDISNIQKFSNSNSDVLTAYSRATQSNSINTDASYIRLKNISLSYQMGSNWMKKLHLQNARLYIQGQNLITITKYKGLDPETRGILPPLRVLTVGAQLTF